MEYSPFNNYRSIQKDLDNNSFRDSLELENLNENDQFHKYGRVHYQKKKGHIFQMDSSGVEGCLTGQDKQYNNSYSPPKNFNLGQQKEIEYASISVADDTAKKYFDRQNNVPLNINRGMLQDCRAGQYPRNLTTRDIDGAIYGSSKPQAVQNLLKLKKKIKEGIQNEQEVDDEIRKQKTQPAGYHKDKDNYDWMVWSASPTKAENLGTYQTPKQRISKQDYLSSQNANNSLFPNNSLSNTRESNIFQTPINSFNPEETFFSFSKPTKKSNFKNDSNGFPREIPSFVENNMTEKKELSFLNPKISTNSNFVRDDKIHNVNPFINYKYPNPQHSPKIKSDLNISEIVKHRQLWDSFQTPQPVNRHRKIKVNMNCFGEDPSNKDKQNSLIIRGRSTNSPKQESTIEEKIKSPKQENKNQRELSRHQRMLSAQKNLLSRKEEKNQKNQLKMPEENENEFLPQQNNSFDESNQNLPQLSQIQVKNEKERNNNQRSTSKENKVKRERKQEQQEKLLNGNQSKINEDHSSMSAKQIQDTQENIKEEVHEKQQNQRDPLNGSRSDFAVDSGNEKLLKGNTEDVEKNIENQFCIQKGDSVGCVRELKGKKYEKDIENQQNNSFFKPFTMNITAMPPINNSTLTIPQYFYQHFYMKNIGGEDTANTSKQHSNKNTIKVHMSNLQTQSSNYETAFPFEESKSKTSQHDQQSENHYIFNPPSKGLRKQECQNENLNKNIIHRQGNNKFENDVCSDNTKENQNLSSINKQNIRFTSAPKQANLNKTQLSNNLNKDSLLAPIRDNFLPFQEEMWRREMMILSEFEIKRREAFVEFQANYQRELEKNIQRRQIRLLSPQKVTRDQKQSQDLNNLSSNQKSKQFDNQIGIDNSITQPTQNESKSRKRAVTEDFNNEQQDNVPLKNTQMVFLPYLYDKQNKVLHPAWQDKDRAEIPNLYDTDNVGGFSN